MKPHLKKSTRNVMDREENHLVSLGNLLLPSTITLPATTRTYFSCAKKHKNNKMIVHQFSEKEGGFVSGVVNHMFFLRGGE